MSAITGFVNALNFEPFKQSIRESSQIDEESCKTLLNSSSILRSHWDMVIAKLDYFLRDITNGLWPVSQKSVYISNINTLKGNIAKNLSKMSSEQLADPETVAANIDREIFYFVLENTLVPTDWKLIPTKDFAKIYLAQANEPATHLGGLTLTEISGLLIPVQNAIHSKCSSGDDSRYYQLLGSLMFASSYRSFVADMEIRNVNQTITDLVRLCSESEIQRLLSEFCTSYPAILNEVLEKESVHQVKFSATILNPLTLPSQDIDVYKEGCSVIRNWLKESFEIKTFSSDYGESEFSVEFKEGVSRGVPENVGVAILKILGADNVLENLRTMYFQRAL